MQRHNPTTEQRNNVELCEFFFSSPSFPYNELSPTIPSDQHTRLPLPVFVLRPTEM